MCGLKTIWVNTRLKDFIHCWPEAPEEVSFLRNLHRHELHVRVELEVNHNERALEFFMVKRKLDTILQEGQKEWPERMSMESICEYLAEKLAEVYGQEALVAITVSEDGEVGSTLMF